MSTGNQALAQALAERAEPEEILAHLVSGGVLIATGPDETVMIGELSDGSTALPAYTSPGAFATERDDERLHQADAALLIEIARDAEVGYLFVDPDGPETAMIPFDDIQRYLVGQGMEIREETEVAFRPTEHPFAPRLAEAVGAALPLVPGVLRCWITDVAFESGAGGLMLHVVLAPDTEEHVVNTLLQEALTGLPEPEVVVYAHGVDTDDEAGIREIGALPVEPTSSD